MQGLAMIFYLMPMSGWGTFVLRVVQKFNTWIQLPKDGPMEQTAAPCKF